MLILLLIPILLLVYLVFEEKDRRAANPGGDRWLDRMRKSARGTRHYFLAVAVGAGIAAARGKGWLEVVSVAALMSAALLFIILHRATLSLPRREEKA